MPARSRVFCLSRVIWFALICCSVGMLAPEPVSAASLQALANATFFNSSGNVCSQTSGGGLGVPDAPLIGCSVTFGPSSFSSSAAASAEFGTLRAFGKTDFSHLSVPSGTFEIGWVLKSFAGMEDTLTIAQGSFLDITVDFSGTFSNAGAAFSIDGGTVPTVLGPNTFRIPFKAGVPFLFEEGLNIDLSGLITLNDNQDQTFSKFADFSHSVRIVSTQVLDSQGNPLPGTVITSESGFDYNNPVPEPGSSALIGAGLAGLAVLRRIRPYFPAP